MTEPSPTFDAVTVQALLDERRSTIERELTAAAAGASLCAISRRAGSVPAAKYLEGRHAAVARLRRAIGRGADPAEAVAEARQSWHGSLADAEARALGPDWRAYHAGGVDELDALIEALEAPMR